MVEALGYNTRVVSTSNGSIGITETEAGGMLTIVPDNDWESFALQMTAKSVDPAGNIPDSFYKKFYWGNIALQAKDFITNPDQISSVLN